MSASIAPCVIAGGARTSSNGSSGQSSDIAPGARVSQPPSLPPSQLSQPPQPLPPSQPQPSPARSWADDAEAGVAVPDYSMPAVIPPRRPGDQRDGKRPALAATPPSTPSPPRSPPPSPPVRSRSPRDPPPPPGRARGRGLLPPRTLAFLTIVGLISPVSPATPPLGTPTSSCPAAYFIPTAAATSLRSDALAIAQPTPAVTLPPGPPTLAVTPPPAGDAARSDANALGTPQPTPAVISPIAPPLPTWTTLWLLLPSQTKRTPLGALTLSLGRQCQTLAVTMSASAACLLLHHHPLENAAASLARSLLANPSPLSRALVGVTAP